jgi:hypothetical protein
MDIMNEELLERIERALGFKLYEWQKEYILGRLNTSPYGRMQGKTTAHILRQLFAMPTPLYLPPDIRILKCVVDEHHTTSYYSFYRKMALEIADTLLRNERIVTRPIITETDPHHMPDEVRWVSKQW